MEYFLKDNTNEYKKVYPKRLNSRHFLLLREMVAGTRLEDAAKLCGYTYARAAVVSTSKLFKDEKILLREQINSKYAEVHSTALIDEAREILVDDAVRAARSVSGLIDSPEPKIALAASCEVLDRVGITKPKEHASITANLAVSDNLAFALQLKVAN